MKDATSAAQEFLDALGFDTTSPATKRTAERMASAYQELLRPQDVDAVSFENESSYSGLVLVRNIEFVSLCEHHALPFFGRAAVGYLPDDRIIGLSKLARVVSYFSKRPQVQERLTVQIRDWLVRELAPVGVGVVLEATHTCMSIRGASATAATTHTFALAGSLLDDRDLRAEFLQSVRTAGK